jgi:hydrogenase maturation protein HypF
MMAPSTAAVAAVATLSPAEREVVESVRRPIVLVETDPPGARPDWLDAVAPGLHTVGAMLPYSGLHHLLFDRLADPVVATSANRPGEPMCTDRTAVRDRLDGVVDAALVHDRPVVNRCDDSVVRVVDGHRRFLRRSRGWVPESLPRREEGPPVLAVGPERSATVALAAGESVVLSQHLGDVTGPADLAFHRSAVDRLRALTGVDPAVVARDAHPGYLTTAEARDRAAADLAGPVAVQHHHAHAAALLAEHDRDRAVVVTVDGTGHGPDGTVWGGEVLDTTRERSDRVGGLATFRLPGGEAAVDSPGRTAASLLADPDRVETVLRETGVGDGPDDRAAVRRQARRGVNAPRTTSAGRFLDAASALLGVCRERRYEGEPAMRLEAVAARGDPLELAVPYADRDGDRVVDVHELFRWLADRRHTHDRADLAATAQAALATGLADVAVEAARESGVRAVGLTGGVAHNDAVVRRVRDRVERSDRTFLAPDRVPPGDGGVAYGQAVVATARGPPD